MPPTHIHQGWRDREHGQHAGQQEECADRQAVPEPRASGQPRSDPRPGERAERPGYQHEEEGADRQGVDVLAHRGVVVDIEAGWQREDGAADGFDGGDQHAGDDGADQDGQDAPTDGFDAQASPRFTGDSTVDRLLHVLAPAL